MKSKSFLRAIVLLAMLASLLPAGSANALADVTLPPADTFQLPWDQGLAWMAIDGLDNGSKRPLDSSHHYTVGGAVDFAPHKNMAVGENTSQFWVAAAGAGKVVEKSFCHLKIDHGNGWISEYQFLANVQVKLGDSVYRNQRLAIIANGTTQKFCPGSKEINIPHLHFMLRPTLRNVTFAGWQLGYVPLLNRTTFAKGSETLGLFKPLLNALELQIVSRGPIVWDTTYTGNVDTYRYERWSLALTEMNKFTLTATPTTTGLVPLLVLLDANGNEIARGTGTLTSTQPAGSYFVQVQPQSGNGFYSLLLKKEDLPLPTGPYVTTLINPASVNVGGTAVATISLSNVPAEGYTSAEFTCTYNASLVEAKDIVIVDLFGNDPAMAINGPQNGSFIVAVAGTFGNKATNGNAFRFGLTGLQAGQAAIDCQARVSTGDNLLTEISSLPGNLTVTGDQPPTPTFTPSPAVPPTPTDTPTPVPPTPTFTATPTLPTGEWLTFTNTKYQFEFKYPPQAQVVAGGTENSTRIDLPFAAGTNLSQKYLEMIVVEDASPCRSPLATSSMLQTSEIVIINGISFLKETGEDGTAGHINKWTAYSAARNNACVSLDFVLRSANPGVFTTPIPLYDEALEKAVFDQIMATYAWLATLPTATFTPSPTSTASPTPTHIPDAIVEGKVIASKPVTVSLYDVENTLVTSVTVGADGTFSFTTSTSPGTYTLVATASGFLSAQGSVEIVAEGTTTKPVISLLAGDIDNNKVIDQFDALTIGMSYNTAAPAAADLNADGVINVLDLELLARNYRKTGPQTW